MAAEDKMSKDERGRATFMVFVTETGTGAGAGAGAGAEAEAEAEEMMVGTGVGKLGAFKVTAAMGTLDETRLEEGTFKVGGVAGREVAGMLP